MAAEQSASCRQARVLGRPGQSRPELRSVNYRPLRVDGLNAAFAQFLEQQLDQGRDEALAVWHAFAELVRRPVSAAGVAPAITEDLVMFDVAADERPVSNLSFVRRVGLADANGDYLRAIEFSCSLSYAAGPRIAWVSSGAVHRSFAPDRDVDEVNRFLAEYERGDLFKLFVVDLTPTAIDFDP